MSWKWTARSGDDVSYWIVTQATEPALAQVAVVSPDTRPPPPRVTADGPVEPVARSSQHAPPAAPHAGAPYAAPAPTLVDDPPPVTARDPVPPEAWPPPERKPASYAEGHRPPPAPETGPASGRSGEQPVSRRGLPGSLLCKDAPPPILPPEGLREEGRCWTSIEALPVLRFGCCSHRGPEWTWVDKENEDFAFTAVRRAQNGDPWVLAGVCDGVGNSTWSERGAKLAAEAFLDVVSRCLAEVHALADEMQQKDGKRAFATAFQRRMRELLETDAKLLLEGRYLHASWKEELYERTFLHGRDAHERRAEWLQTTLLAAALGPRGGFALLLGDGLIRVDRYRKGKRVRRNVIPLQGDPRAPEHRVSLALTVDEVEHCLRGVLPEQGDRVDIVLTTDGVSKSPRHGLEDRVLLGEDDCRRFLDELAGRAKGDVESDNMSVAFASRETRS